MYEDPNSYSAINRQALFSLILAILALLSFCIGAAPLPMTALFCYPSSLLLGIGALWTGIKALQQVRGNNERGQTLAKIGIWIGSLSILFVILAITLVILLWPVIFDFLQNFWHQIAT